MREKNTNVMKVYAAYNNNFNEVMKGSSGGIFSILAKKIKKKRVDMYVAVYLIMILEQCILFLMKMIKLIKCKNQSMFKAIQVQFLER